MEWRGQAHVDAAIIAEHLDELNKSYNEVETFIDKRIAHRDKAKAERSLTITFTQLHNVVDLLDAKTSLLIGLLRQEAFIKGLLPIWQYDWRKVFFAPWLVRPNYNRSQAPAQEKRAESEDLAP